jgi:hypothetical protein
VGRGSGQGMIPRYDGQGWIQEPIPSTLESFWDVWVASSGEVFAVGSEGNVIRGP